MRASEQAAIIVETLDGAFSGDQVVVAVAALDDGGAVTAVSPGCPPDARFEIGSVTKTMTATLLATLLEDGTVGLDDAIGRWLDAGPNAGITLGELATHTSGLPRLAPNQPVTGTNPYRDFTAERAEEGVRAATRTPGAERIYSNFGYQLLGLALERASGHSYQELLSGRLLRPLGMTYSGLGAAGDGTRLTGYTGGQPAEHWDHPLPGPGGVEATIGDLSRYLAACLSPPQTPLGAAIRRCQQAHVRIDDQRAGGLGWMISHDGRILLHNGGTGGFAASVGLDLSAKRAAGVLVNTHGRSVAALDSVVLLALTGGDIHQARPQPHGDTPGPEWDQQGHDLVAALIGGRFTDVHHMLLPANRDKLTAEQIGHAWRRALAQAGEPGKVSISCRSLPAGVGALAVIDCARRPLLLLTMFMPSGHIGGLRILGPDEVPPW